MYLPQVEGRIGDQTHLKFILDTGASISIVDQRLVEKLKLDSGAAKSFNFDRNLEWDTATVPEVQFGPIRAANVAVLVGDLARYSEFAKKADAIIGMDLLKLSDVTIDFDARNLIFDSTKVRRGAMDSTAAVLRFAGVAGTGEGQTGEGQTK
jgi:predicted aspartyl protease